jgi:hypothetical protein
MFEKILKIYPELTIEDFIPGSGTIELRNDSDGKGDYVFKWEHPTLPHPTQEQLDGAA